MERIGNGIKLNGGFGGILAVFLQAVERTGIKKEVIVTFPTVKAHELRVDIKEGLQ